MLTWLLLAAVEKDAFFTAMTMHVDHQSDAVLSVQDCQVSLKVVDFRVQS